jgi:transposase InsO family protein
MESFFHTLKTELFYRRHYETRVQARGEIFEYIEVFVCKYGSGYTQQSDMIVRIATRDGEKALKIASHQPGEDQLHPLVFIL